MGKEQILDLSSWLSKESTSGKHMNGQEELWGKTCKIWLAYGLIYCSEKFLLYELSGSSSERENVIWPWTWSNLEQFFE